MPLDQPTTDHKSKRIFWFGAHKLLVNTELARLRHLGFEVFNPPYLSHILDQSAVTSWDGNQITTLPADVFETLSGYNFFYNTIDPEIAELLRNYFDAVVVTLVARWATEILRVFPGTVVFRTYGQTSLLSNDLKRAGALPFILERDNFHFSPHATETGEVEEDWLQQRMTVIPYCLSDDVFESQGTWVGSQDDIIVSAPNIQGNPFHRAHYDFLKEFFFQPYYRYVGVQPLGDMIDPQVVGTLNRAAQLDLFRQAAGYLYSYRDPRVCYLPPVEMMVFGGPVIYLSGSLLARYIGPNGPGEAATVATARQKCERLRDRQDPQFARAVQASQRSVIDRYNPKFVWPVFDEKMCALLPKKRTAREEVRASPHLFPQISPAWGRLQAYAADLLTGLVTASPATSEPEEMALAPLLNLSTGTDIKFSVIDRLKAGETVLQVVRAMTDAPELLTPVAREMLFKPPAWHDSEKLDVLGRTNFLTKLGTLGVGHWIQDPQQETPARLAPAGTGGFLLYGPYIQLDPGRYELQFRFRAIGGLGDAAGTVDVLCDGDEVVALRLFAQEGRPQVLRYMLEVTNATAKYEFRVVSNGQNDFYLHAVSLQSVVQNWEKPLIIKNLLNGGGALGIGKWMFDPGLQISSRCAKAGERGYLHWGDYIRLEPGHYHAAFAFRATGRKSEKPVGRVDILAGGQRTVAATDVFTKGGQLQKIQFNFVAQAGEEYEFRVDTWGLADFYLYSLSLGAGPGPSADVV